MPGLARLLLDTSLFGWQQERILEATAFCCLARRCRDFDQNDNLKKTRRIKFGIGPATVEFIARRIWNH